ncbi:MAG: glycoside hydrolase family 95 protein [Roseburia sp.]|nr:glycoside hydrolase family 95 protein [Roseburia sp.]
MKRLWFDRPADNWNEAWPIGNGRLGAMVSGGIYRETLQINQDSMYYGGPRNRVNPDAKENLDKVRSLLLEGRIPEAEELLRYAFSGTPQSQGPYQSLGTVELVYHIEETEQESKKKTSCDAAKAESYCRELDMEQGIVRESYLLGGCRIAKEYFASYPNGVIAIDIDVESEAKGIKISLEAVLARVSGGQYYCDRTGRLDACSIFMEGVQGAGGISWCVGLRAQAREGNIRVCGEHLLVKGAKRITLYLGCETSFYEKDWKRVLAEKLDRAAAMGYEAMKEAHVRDYRQLFDRVSLVLETETDEIYNENVAFPPVDQVFRARDFQDSFVPLYFQYGRYLMISGSRPGSLPLNLQGIWNDSFEPPWGCRYTININTEMNYWPAETCSLPECHMPLFDHLLRMWENGKKVAQEMYGCRGFVAHHNTDLWGDCAPQDIWIPSTYWVMGAAWLSTHIWQHYFYTQDEAFLRKFYPVMKDAVLFFHDFLIEVDGKLMTCPSISPENTYILQSGVKGCNGVGAAMDSEILRDLMEGFLRASKVLEIRDDVTEQTREILRKLPELQIGKHGQIMEWREDYEEEEPGHRHISQLYALHPSHQITADRTPALAEAARRTLERRLQYGGGHTGWSCAWIVNFYARLGDGDKALESLERLWEKSTFFNLMDNHPMAGGFLFQIDGNMGATAAIVELLVQSDEDRVILMPALPGKWKKGRLTGVSIGKGVKMDLEWQDGKVSGCYLRAACDREIVMVYGQQRKTVHVTAGKCCEVNFFS